MIAPSTLVARVHIAIFIYPKILKELKHNLHQNKRANLQQTIIITKRYIRPILWGVGLSIGIWVWSGSGLSWGPKDAPQLRILFKTKLKLNNLQSKELQVWENSLPLLSIKNTVAQKTYIRKRLNSFVNLKLIKKCI